MGQGALAVECREDDAESLGAAAALAHRETLLACVAERAFMRTLDGGCSAPVAAHAEVSGANCLIVAVQSRMYRVTFSPCGPWNSRLEIGKVLMAGGLLL